MFSEHQYLDEGRADPGDLRAILHDCRADLTDVRKQAHSGAADGTGPASELDARLCQLAERLDRATTLLEQIAPATRAAGDAIGLRAREADHRIRNSLQTVSSVLQRQAAHATHPEVTEALRDASARVLSVAQVHALLHGDGAGGLAGPLLDLSVYLSDLCAGLAVGLGLAGEDRALRVEMDTLLAAPEVVQPIGLIVTELVINAARHAFTADQKAVVQVTGRLRGDGGYQLCVEDNGKGLPKGFELKRRPNGLGLRLAILFSDQLRGSLAHAVGDGGGGTRFLLTLPADVVTGRQAAA